VIDYGFAKFFRMSQTTHVGLVDENKRTHQALYPRTVTISFVSEEIDGWYAYLLRKRLIMRETLSDAESIPVRIFVTSDIANYFLEFDWFYKDPKNTKILEFLK
jgi:hypothetical protein